MSNRGFVQLTNVDTEGKVIGMMFVLPSDVKRITPYNEHTTVVHMAQEASGVSKAYTAYMVHGSSTQVADRIWGEQKGESSAHDREVVLLQKKVVYKLENDLEQAQKNYSQSQYSVQKLLRETDHLKKQCNEQRAAIESMKVEAQQLQKEAQDLKALTAKMEVDLQAAEARALENSDCCERHGAYARQSTADKELLANELEASRQRVKVLEAQNKEYQCQTIKSNHREAQSSEKLIARNRELENTLSNIRTEVSIAMIP